MPTTTTTSAAAATTSTTIRLLLPQSPSIPRLATQVGRLVAHVPWRLLLSIPADRSGDGMNRLLVTNKP